MIPADPPPGLSPWYVTGFAEGQGAFTYGRSGRQLALYFALKLPARDLPLLEAVRSFFQGIGKIYTVRTLPAASKGGGPTRATRYFRVSRRDDLSRVVEHFDRFPLQGAKREAYLIWREMVMLKLERFRRPPMQPLEALATRLSSSRGAHPEP